MENVPPASFENSPLLTSLGETPCEVAAPAASPKSNPSIWAFLCLLAGLLLFFFVSGIDSTAVLFLNRFVGQNARLDGAVELIADTFVLHGALFVALVWYFWFRNRSEESRTRLCRGAIAAVSAGLLSRLLQLTLPFHLRPLYAANLHLRWPVGVGPELNHWNCFPSDHAALFFAFATLVWINDRRLGVVTYLWAAIMSAIRVYLGYHYPTDVIGSAVLGSCLVVISQILPFPKRISGILDWERCAPGSFYAVGFIASYQAATLFNDIRAVGRLIGQLLLRHPI
jgi:undecaprenyl-diphosphatase